MTTNTIIQLSKDIPQKNPVTGASFTEEELRLFITTHLKPVTPWYDIELLNDDFFDCRSNFVKIVGQKPVIYIYRLKNDPSVVYIGSSVNCSRRFSAHRRACKNFILYGLTNSGCSLFYNAVKKYGWKAFHVAALVLPNDSSKLDDMENVFLALKPSLNSKQVHGGLLRHSAQTVQLIKERLGSGEQHHSYGIKWSNEKKWIARKDNLNRKIIYQYNVNYEFTGIQYDSLRHAWQVTGIHIDKLMIYVNTSVLLKGFRFSTAQPSTGEGKQTDKYVLAVRDRPLADPFLGVRHSIILPVCVTHIDYDIVQYFLSPKQAAEVINKGLIWTNCTVSYKHLYKVLRNSKNQTHIVKNFKITCVTREEFLKWYLSASVTNQIFSVPPIETRHR